MDSDFIWLPHSYGLVSSFLHPPLDFWWNLIVPLRWLSSISTTTISSTLPHLIQCWKELSVATISVAFLQTLGDYEVDVEYGL